jgi:cytidyltransferase-like protein
MEKKIHVFVSGCYDILHAGHIQFFKEAKALGDELTVCFASSDVLWAHKGRRGALPDEHKQAILESLSMVDHVVIGRSTTLGLDFEDHFLRLKPDILAVTDDDQYGDLKRELCTRVGASYTVLKKTPPSVNVVSTTDLLRFIQAPDEVPLRVDFAGGWLDVPCFARQDAYIVNCAIAPLVSLRHWGYRSHSGLGGSGAYSLLQGDNAVSAETNSGVGWQDPAVIRETGLCVWRSGLSPVLDFKRNGEVLSGRMALLWTGQQHDTPSLAKNVRDYDGIERAGKTSRQAVLENSLELLAQAVQQSYSLQLDEGMQPLPDHEPALARKYCGGGWGGYALYIFASPSGRERFLAEADTMAVEPYLRPIL